MWITGSRSSLEGVNDSAKQWYVVLNKDEGCKASGKGSSEDTDQSVADEDACDE